MQKLSLLFLLLISTITISAQTHVDEIRAKLFNPDLGEVLVVAHRGDWRNFPENSLEAIESAIKMGVDVVELDVQKTKDGQFILMHDATLNRTTTGKGAISEWTLDSIKTLNLRNGCAIKTKHKVPTLEEALIVAKGKIMINLDKADRYFDEIYLLLEKTGTTKQIIMKGSKSPELVKEQFGKYLNKVIYMPIVHLDKPNALENIKVFLKEIKPVAFELLYVSDENKTQFTARDLLKGRALTWYNTLWDTMAGGHDDDMALENPDNAYGYLINELNTRIIQTDRPHMLIRYLKSTNLH